MDFKRTSGMDMKVRLSLLWLFAVLNYLYADVVALYDPTFLRQLVTGAVGSIQFNQGTLLVFSAEIEIPIAMVLLSRILKFRTNRWANIVAGAVMTVVQVSTLLIGTPTLYYVFFSILEIASTTLIIWYAWRWHPVVDEL
jgi:Family of unknown function (DUF6326)